MAAAKTRWVCSKSAGRSPSTSILRAASSEKGREFNKLPLEATLPRSLRGPVESRLLARLALACAGLGSLLIRLMIFSPF
jgi:hypothetical protein